MAENFSNQVIETLQSLRYQSNELQVQVNGKEKTIPYQSSAPTSPTTSDLWVDSSGVTPTLKVYDGASWVSLGGSPTDDDQNILANRVFG